MGPKSGGDGAKEAANPVTEALDRLYAAPLEGFVELRRELTTSLRAAGEVPASRLVAGATKPSRTAWALNQVVRRHAKLMTAVLEAHATALEAQSQGNSEAVLATARAYRDRVAEVVDAAGEILRDSGGELQPAQGRRIAATVQALIGAQDPETRARLLAGRLVADEEVDDPFGGGVAIPVSERARAEPAGPREPPRRDDLAVRREAAERARAAQREQERKARELAKARERVAAIEQAAREARAAARQAEILATRAQSEAERARRAVDAVEQRLDDAMRALRELSA